MVSLFRLWEVVSIPLHLSLQGLYVTVERPFPEKILSRSSPSGRLTTVPPWDLKGTIRSTGTPLNVPGEDGTPLHDSETV